MKKRILACMILMGVFAIGVYSYLQKQQKISSSTQQPPDLVHYEAQKFDLAGKLKGLSSKQINEHEQLYQGYVNKRNEIFKDLQTADRSAANNVTYSPYRGLKIAQTFAMNGDILHRLYFENLGAQNSKVGPQMLELINHRFGSFEKFKEDVYAAGRSARGWVLVAYTLDDGLIENYVLDAHNLTVPVMVMPLLVLDVYEHAYMIDFGINRVNYLDTFWQNINWDVVEQRIDQWVNPFRNVTKTAAH